jgi:hypothetical protein
MATADPLGEHSLLQLARALEADQSEVLSEDDVAARIPARMRATLAAPGESGRPAEADGPQTAEAALLAAAEGIDAAGVERLAALTRQLCEHTHEGRSGAGAWLSETAEEVHEMRALAASLAADVAGAEAILQELDGIDPQAQGMDRRLADACARLPAHLAAAEQVLGDYHRLELGLAAAAMRARRAEVELEARRLRDLTLQIRSIESRLQPGRGRLFGFLRRRPARAERQRLTERLRRLDERRRGPGTFMEEREIGEWLQTLVRAGVEMSPEAWEQASGEARWLLYQLLNVFTLQSRVSPHEVAERAILGAGARDALEYYAESELYLSRYLSRQRLELFTASRAASGARIERFAHVRDTLTREYRALGEGT